MKKILPVLLFILVCFISISSKADDSQPFSGLDWNKESAESIYLSSYEKAFVDLYNVAENYKYEDKVFNAFAMMKSLFAMNGLDQKYEDDAIVSQELKQILSELMDSAKDPKTVREYFYKGLLAYAPEPEITTRNSEMIDNFRYVIDNFPDTDYAKYSYILLADNYRNTNRKEETVEVLNNFLEKYGEKDELTYIVYYRLADVLYIGQEGDKEGELKRLILEYSQKIIDEFPEKEKIVGAALIKLGHYYFTYSKDYNKAIEYYNKVVDNANHSLQNIFRASEMLVKAYKKIDDIASAEEFLENMRQKYANTERRDLVNPDIFREFYIKAKLNLEEIKRFGFDSEEFGLLSTRDKYKDIYREKKEEIEKFRQEWTYKYDLEWRGKKKIIGLNDVVSFILTEYEPPFNYYSKVSHNDKYYYDDEQPIIQKVTIAMEKGLIKIGYSDWYNRLKFYVVPYKHLYEYDASGSMIKEEGYTSEHEVKKQLKRSGAFKVLQGEDLLNGILEAGKKKNVTIEVFDVDNNSFKSGYYYEVAVGFQVRNGRLIYDWLGNQNHVEFDVIEPTTPDQIKDWTIRKGDKAVKEKKYKDAVKHYQEVLEKEKENQRIRKILLQKLANTYELNKDYPNAKKYLSILLKHVDGEIEVAKDDKELLDKLQEEKAQIQKKIKEIDALIKK